MHEEALMALTAANGKAGAMKRAEVFFKEAIAPIEDTHHAAREANADLNQANKTLDRRTVDLADSKASLKKGITRRKTLERLLRKSGKHSQKLLKESRHLQKHLQHLTHQVLFAHEDKRKKISTDLRDEIGQTLLGINVRLLTLKQAAMVDTASLKQDIVSTQRLVDRSVKIINRFAREFGKRHES
jgi:signal transduction histidine kinase